MAIERVEALILQTSPSGEQDKLVTFFTADRGVLRGVAKGSRKFGNRFGSSLEPLSHVQIVFYEKEIRDFVTVSQCDLLESFFELQSDVRTAFSLSYFAEMVREFVPVRSSEDTLFRLLLRTLEALKKGGDLELLSAYFEAWILRLSGVTPDVSSCLTCRRAISEAGWLAPRKDGVFCPDCAPQRKDEVPAGLGLFLEWSRGNPPPEIPLPQFPSESVKAVRRFLQTLLIFHMEREPKSLRYLK